MVDIPVVAGKILKPETFTLHHPSSRTMIIPTHQPYCTAQSRFDIVDVGEWVSGYYLHVGRTDKSSWRLHFPKLSLPDSAAE
jgi:endogenous inhibitor of DNA gyrase (YacG/DUF329 family)